jgi:hypothetical protein
LAAERARYWFASLWPHLRAQWRGLRNVPTEPEACRFVVVEDFGTTGLLGDPARGMIPDRETREIETSCRGSDGWEADGL